MEIHTWVNYKDIQGLAMTEALLLGKPILHVKYYTYRKQAETTLTTPHTLEIVNLEIYLIIFIYFVTHRELRMNLLSGQFN